MMKKLRVVSLLLLLAAILSVTGHAGAEIQSVTISWDTYWKQVEDTRRVIQECEQIPPEEVHGRLTGLIAQWEGVGTIDMPDGRSIAVNQSYLVALLKADTPDFNKIDKLLGVMLAERDIQSLAPDNIANEALLSRILNQSEFQWKDQNRQSSALEKLWQNIRDDLSKLSQTFFGFQGANYVIAAGAVVLFLLMIIFMFRNLVITFVAESHLGPRGHAGGEELSADAALQRAQGLSMGGDYRSAVRYLYLSALLSLEERGLLRPDRTKTNQEYLRSIRGSPELVPPLRDLVEVFDRVWYGFQPLTDHRPQPPPGIPDCP